MDGFVCLDQEGTRCVCDLCVALYCTAYEYVLDANVGGRRKSPVSPVSPFFFLALSVHCDSAYCLAAQSRNSAIWGGTVYPSCVFEEQGKSK